MLDGVKTKIEPAKHIGRDLMESWIHIY